MGDEMKRKKVGRPRIGKHLKSKKEINRDFYLRHREKMLKRVKEYQKSIRVMDTLLKRCKGNL